MLYRENYALVKNKDALHLSDESNKCETWGYNLELYTMYKSVSKVYKIYTILSTGRLKFLLCLSTDSKDGTTIISNQTHTYIEL